MNKKFLSIVALACILVLGCVNLTSAAGIRSGCEIKDASKFTLEMNGEKIECSGKFDYNGTADADKNAGICCLMAIVNNVANWIFVILTAVAVIVIMLAAWTFITNAGDPEKAGAARNYIIWSAVGLAVAMLAKAIPSVVTFIVGS